MYTIDLGVLQVIGNALLDENTCENCVFYHYQTEEEKCTKDDCYYTAVKRAHMRIVLDEFIDDDELPF